MELSQEEKKFYIEQGLKVGLVVFAVYAVKKMIPSMQPGRTDKIPFDLEKTQNRYFYTSTDPPVVQVVPDPWTPASLARRLHTAMNGVNWKNPDTRTPLYKEVDSLGVDRARYLHNYWLTEIDPENTLYRWISTEYGEWDYSAEKEKVLNNLSLWGVGF